MFGDVSSALERDDVREDLIERRCRLPAEKLSDLTSVRDAPRHVVESVAIGFLVWDQGNLGPGSAGVLDPLSQLEHRDLFGRTDVEHLPVDILATKQLAERADNVSDVAEAALLRARAEYRDRFLRERLPHERRDDHPVATALSRANGVEQAPHYGRQAALAVVRDREELIERLRARVCPAPANRRAHHEITVLTERDRGGLAVDLAGGCDEYWRLLPVGQCEHHLGRVDVCLDRPHRALHDQLYADGRREVIDEIGLRDGFFDYRLVVAGTEREAEPGVCAEPTDVLQRSSRQVVDHLHAVSAGE